MYDDIAHDPMNPRPGVIINHPRGRDVYAGVPKITFNVDSEVHNLRTESLRQQYLLVKKRTEAEIENGRGSHVMQYGSLRLSDDPLYLYMGTNPYNEDSIFGQDNSLSLFSTAVSQRDADLVYLWQKYLRMPDNTPEKNAVWTELLDEMAERYHVDNAVALIGVLLFGPVDSPKILSMIRTAEEPLVDDWSCLKSMVHAYEEQCGRLSHYGLRHSRSFANMCNAGIRPQTMANAAAQACKTIPSKIWESIHKGSRA